MHRGFLLWLSILHQRLTGISFPFPSLQRRQPRLSLALQPRPDFFFLSHVPVVSIGSFVLARLQEYTWRDRALFFALRATPLFFLTFLYVRFGTPSRAARRGVAGDASARVDVPPALAPLEKTAGKGFNRKCAEWRRFYNRLP